MDRSLCHGLWVPTSEIPVLARYSLFEGLPDLDVSKVAACADLDPLKRRALDIGAHVGATTVYLAREFETVTAFEPIPVIHEMLRMNVENLPNAETLNVAVGAEAGEVSFAYYHKHGQLSHAVSTKDYGQRSETVGPIPVVTIDSFAYDDVSFMKIDVEGFELFVLEGARETILRCHPLILVEQAGNEAKYFDRPLNEASVWLEDIGMRQRSCAVEMNKDRLYTFEGALT